MNVVKIFIKQPDKIFRIKVFRTHAFLNTIIVRPQMNLFVVEMQNARRLIAKSNSSVVSICFWKGASLPSKQTNRVYGRAPAYAFPAIAGSIQAKLKVSSEREIHL